MQHKMIDLRREHETSLARPRLGYSAAARIFFASMNLVTGRKTTLPKAKLLETLASIPYREWEKREYGRLTRRYRDREAVMRSRRVVEWGRAAQDNEYYHLLVIQEKMEEEGLTDPWYLKPPLPRLMTGTYRVIARLLATASLRRAFLFNAEFEDHAEHEYARFVADHPEWETQPAENAVVTGYTEARTWADVFRRICLDERDHMNHSFVCAGLPEMVVPYEGMPEGILPADKSADQES
jgi:hypothetical protein